MQHENARPGVAAGTGGEQVDETGTSVAIRRGGDLVVMRRRNARAVDDYLDQMGYRLTPAQVLSLTVAPYFRDLAPCGGPHTGPCDYWGSCTGVHLGVAERDAAGRVHPWRLVA